MMTQETLKQDCGDCPFPLSQKDRERHFGKVILLLLRKKILLNKSGCLGEPVQSEVGVTAAALLIQPLTHLA